MKTYIFIIRRICHISGAQQYVYNKVKFLEEQGWRVLVFSSIHREVLIHGFERYQKYIIPALYFSPSVFRKRDVDSTINKIINEIGNCHGDACVIESDSLPRAIWGELIASRLNCRHLAFFMQEWHHYDDEMKSFLRFKYERHELAGITTDSLFQMFGDESIEARDDTRISAQCKNVVVDCEDRYSQLLDDTSDYTLASIGRLNKPCVPAIIDGFCSYVSRYPDKRFNVVMIGGSLVKGKVDEVRKHMKEYNNINLVMTGDMYPIPLSFVQKIDVFVSAAGSAGATFIVGQPTVRVNPANGEPIGVMGLDNLEGKSMFDSSCNMSIDDCIERAITQRDRIAYNGTNQDDLKKIMTDEFERQLSFLSRCDKKEYYDEKFLLRLKTPNHDKPHVHLIHCILGHVLGANQLENIRKRMGKI